MASARQVLMGPTLSFGVVYVTTVAYSMKKFRIKISLYTLWKYMLEENVTKLVLNFDINGHVRSGSRPGCHRGRRIHINNDIIYS